MGDCWRRKNGFLSILYGLSLLVLLHCGHGTEPSVKSDGPAADAVPVLLVTLDTTRADHLGYEGGEPTPTLDALAKKAIVYRRAYTTAPTTLPSHVSMMTGLYPYEHGIHENARYLNSEITTLAQKLSEAKYTTAAFVSGYPLAATFGLARGFDHYEQPPDGQAERSARATTALALQYLEGFARDSTFLWVHYYDPHAPYQPPAELAETYADRPYMGEIIAMDRALGQLIAAFEARFAGKPYRIIVVGDHGEGLGEGGETQHGHLLSEGVMRVPMLVAGPGLPAGEEQGLFSTRKVFNLILGLTGLGPAAHQASESVVLAEAMKPFLQYGWAPQTLALSGDWKAVRAKSLQIFSLETDPKAEDDLFGKVAVPGEILAALESYALPESLGESVALSAEDQARLASLGYTASAGMSVLRDDLPNPADMVHLLPALDEASEVFSRGDFSGAVTQLNALAEVDPNNLMVQLRLAVAYSQTGQRKLAETRFQNAGTISPDSVDVRHFLAMHYLRHDHAEAATPHLEWVLQRQPNRLPALKVLANIREQQGQINEVVDLWQRAAAISGEGPLHLKAALGHMRLRDSQAAANQFAAAVAAADFPFQHHLEWGVCLLDLRSLDEAALQLEKVPADHPGYSLALFKRAQTAALRGDGDVSVWIDRARARNDAQVEQMIRSDGLLKPYLQN